MTNRVTRSAAAATTSNDSNDQASTSHATITDTGSPIRPPTRKRKAAEANQPQPSRKSKRAKAGNNEPEQTTTITQPRKRKTRSSTAADMSSGAPSSSGDTSPNQQVPREKRKSSRRKSKDEPSGSTSASGSRRKHKGSRKDQDVPMKDGEENSEERGGDAENGLGRSDAAGGADEGHESSSRRYDEEERDEMAARGHDPFTSGYLSRFGAHAGLSSSLRALSGIMSGQSGRLRNILEQLKTKEDPSVQMIALQELSELLLVSNEDNLAGHFQPDLYVKELVVLMQPNEFTGEENPEIMLLACRCIANMMEALPAATASVVYGGAVPILCQKLLEIHFIDLAEQALSTLEKISVEFPSSIVREGGLTACLTYLDFFATSTQRTAVTTAANCCRNINDESFATVRDVMPILLSTLSSSDQKVVEQASLCVSRIVDSFKYKEDRLEELVSTDLLKAMLRLLLPGSTNMISQNVHTQFLRVLSHTARSSPRLSVELLKMNVVDTLYQILTGVSAPPITDDAASKIDKNIIMQAIIRTPREQIFETLNVICELLPAISRDSLNFMNDLFDAVETRGHRHPPPAPNTAPNTSPNDKKLELLKGCPNEVKRFAIILFPTLMYAFTSTVNLNVRQKVLTAQLKMLSNLDANILDQALHGVSYASHLASILTQQENASLVTFALQAAELLLKRLQSIYRPQFYREGVMAEITKIAERPLKADVSAVEASQVDIITEHPPQKIEENDDDADDHERAEDEAATIEVDMDHAEEDDEVGEDDEDGDENEDVNDEDHADDDEDDEEDRRRRQQYDDSSSPNKSRRITDVEDVITLRAKRFMEAHSSEGTPEMREKASRVLQDLRNLTAELKMCYSGVQSQGGTELFGRLAKYFDGDALESITSYELMTSGVVDVLLAIFNDPDTQAAAEARSDFLEVFMATSIHSKTAGTSTTPFSVFVLKLQDLLSRSEHFEVITVERNSWEHGGRSAASMLAKQLRLKLLADEDSGIPRPFNNIMVSIHAIATFKALDDYLRPRISMAERPPRSRREGGLTSAMAAYQAMMAGRGAPPPALPTLGSSLPTRSASKKPPRSKSSKSESAVAQETPEAEGTTRLRRSSRRHTTQPSSIDSLAPPAVQTDPEQPEEGSQDTLECADEAQLEDEDDEDMEADLEALVDDLEEGALEEDAPEPSAVNLEVANSGKVTARTEDGTSIGTPSQGTPNPTTQRDRMSAAYLAQAREMLSTPTSSARPNMSFAQALQSTPQDWHIEFSINDQLISSETTIYRACHFNNSLGEEVSTRPIWSATHTIKFKKVQGPPPAERAGLTPPPDSSVNMENGLPPSLNKHPITSGILRLMSILHELNANLEDVLAENKNAVKLNSEPLTQFVNTKLTAKLNRQLEEPLIVASQCLPSWSEDLARLYPFLFPFETRHLFLQSTSFGYARSMSRWQGSGSENDSRHRHRDERPFLGRLQRQKVRISRSRILESAIKVMELYGGSQSILEVEYFEEVGTGLGPTLEFYSTVSKEFSRKKTKLWRENESADSGDYAFGARGLFPAPMDQTMADNDNGKKVLVLFKILGKFVARSMMDSRIIDVSFNPTFFRIGDGNAAVAPALGAVAAVDKDLAKSLKMLKKYASAKQRIEDNDSLSQDHKERKIAAIRINDALIDDLGLDFTLPGYPHIELVHRGSSLNVTIENVGMYISKVVEFTLGSGVQRQSDAFRAGFSQVFPYSALKAFTPDELVMLFGRVEEDWSLETLMDSIKADHGYNLDSKSVRNLLQVMSELSPQAKRDFLQFVTGSPKLPIGGFKSLTPMFTVVCKPSEPPFTSDDYLPSVMTCVNYLKMPDYTDLKILKDKLGFAIREGQGAFHLS
ncbi:Ubiquitin fusion degradation protein 4 [Recurvomyces mirabilis]|uniref:HECT-type E3 ubiquitin transferase n=1 Tax=Recurvomyces mirabilis TaxID=574656 RepID=A0AAE0WLN7_9PEZI|nr:Ubiquitin fusion degradation protein 4 [Recurvomyces mirabilis]KAK5152038.1 Ubiquitin fusion degradation protein 4 [Recurvomyces mirabilis]